MSSTTSNTEYNDSAVFLQNSSLVYPISCVECRRRKIKCCKRYPCKQCVKRSIKCEFPEKFRSIEIGDIINNEISRDPNIISPLSTSGSNILSSTISVNLAKENESLKAKISNLESRLENINFFNNKRLLNNNNNNNNLHDGDEDLYEDIEYNDSELSKEKYYGPNSAIFMVKSTADAKNLEFDQFIKVKTELKHKRELPMLLTPENNNNNNNNNNSSFITDNENLKMSNFSLICQLVSIFFQLRNYCNNFINEKDVFNFLHNYATIKNWSNDDDLLLLIMIIVTTLRSMRRDDPLLVEYNLKFEVINSRLMKQFEHLKNGIRNETIRSLQSYVLACEHYYYYSQAEKSWNMLFHTVANAYSLGLHVYDKEIEISLKNTKKNTLKVIQNDPRTSLWLTINFISSVLCSVVGRPNPVTFTFQPLIKNLDIKLNYKIAISELIKKSTKILIESYKVTIDYKKIMEIDEQFESEIEIYNKLILDNAEERQRLQELELEKLRYRTKRQHLDHNNNNQRQPTKAIKAENQTDNSAKTYRHNQANDFNYILNNEKDSKFSSMDSLSSSGNSASSFTEKFSLLDTDCETYCDLLLCYANRSKFHQPFMSTYQTSTKILLNSVLKVCHYAILLIKTLQKKINNVNFAAIYPFFYCFLYQSFIVFYTFLHLDFENILCFYKFEILEISQHLDQLYKLIDDFYWKQNAIRIIKKIKELVNKFKRQYEKWIKESNTGNLYPISSNQNLANLANANKSVESQSTPVSPFANNGCDSHSNSNRNLKSLFPEISERESSIRVSNGSANNVNVGSNVNANNNNLFGIDTNTFQWDKTLFDNFTVDPVLGFDLNDPFFISNPEGGIPNDYFGNNRLSDGSISRGSIEAMTSTENVNDTKKTLKRQR
ncbi:hypothetical protein PACTADRAFT_48827 [Pachysolen tannophilus NRRL Y-2460]|uniref:Zn(2)-C6 fungal-type domain-containing protein n=1 Tax=Pachysolen tannophilus NRRL Y-2460 TaxID=669874 RepID=A0A1E4TZ91_PACTA|nr:hypothetical protein PACTADRAFT_48827 [Pachysolen tannophilus NRRL Y-2460]